jgi:ribosome-binding protein aMBF1 (putative translation factor)
MLTPATSKAARSLLGWTQQMLSEKSDVSIAAVKTFESGKRTPMRQNLNAMERAFELAGIQFIDQDNGGPGVRLRQGEQS